MGDSLARTYIAGCFAKCGLHPIPGFENLFQSVPILAGIAIDSRSTVTLSHGDKFHELKLNSEFAVDQQSGCGEVEGEVVFLGYGIHMPERGYNDFERLGLAHKIVMCYLYPPRGNDASVRKMASYESYVEKATRIRSRGGSAVIFICPDGIGPLPIEESLPPQHLQQQDIPIIRVSESLAFHIMGDAGEDIDTSKLRSPLENPPQPFCIPNSRISMKIRLDYVCRETYNVMGFLKGEDSTQTLVIGAHYDTERTLSHAMSAGADDNASGVSTVLELARLCASRGRYECNLLFVAFGAEELGNIGSRFLVSNLPDRIGRIKAMLNFDMVGRLNNDVLYVYQAQSAKEWQRVLRGISTNKLDIRFGPNRSATDSGAFYRAGIPVLWFYTGPHANSRARDEIDSINIQGMERIVRYSLDLIECISQDAVSLTFQDGSR